MANVKSWEQHKAECEAVAKEGITILGYVGEWKGATTKLHCSCDKHGEWKTTVIQAFKKGQSCPKCKHDWRYSRTDHYPLKSEKTHIEKFKSAADHKEGATFRRVSGIDWEYTCPVCSKDEYVKAGVCSGVFKTTAARLSIGLIPCRCSRSARYTKDQWEYRLKKECKERGYDFLGWEGAGFGSAHKFNYKCPDHGKQTKFAQAILKGSGCPLCAGHTQQESYLNIVYDESTPVALKFGISNDREGRLIGQNYRNLFQMKCVQVYDFPTVEQCKQAEVACLSELECGILSPRELKDGYSETTSLLNLDKVISIYERFGGVKRLTGETYERKERIS